MSKLTSTTPVSELNGVGKVRALQLKKLGINTVGDLIYFFPRAYEKRGEIRPLSDFESERPCAYLLTVATEVKTANIRRGLSLSKFRAFDESGYVEITFFNLIDNCIGYCYRGRKNYQISRNGYDKTPKRSGFLC